jgi:hypothetical protein
MFSILTSAVKRLTSSEIITTIESVVPPLIEERSLQRTAGSDSARDRQDTYRDQPPPTPMDRIITILSRSQLSLSMGDQRAITRQVLAQAEEAAARIRSERLRQAYLSFNVALGLSVLGVLTIFASLIFLLNSAISAGITSSVVAAVCEAIGVILFRFNKEANDRLDNINRDLNILETTRLIMALVDEISDPLSRDAVIAELVREMNRREQRHQIPERT